MSRPDPRELWAHVDDLRQQLRAAEERAIRAALVATEWRVLKAAELLGIPRTSLQRRISKYPTILSDLERRNYMGPTRKPGAKSAANAANLARG
jgi:DNA-binding NtrC family response regulator